MLETNRRQEKYGRNELTQRAGETQLQILIRQFQQPLIYILLVAVVLTLILREWADVAVIFAVVVVNAGIGFVQEARALTKVQDASQTALFGTSAGGNIALATTLKLKELGEPLPGAVFAGTPATDLENISDTWHTMVGLDPLGARQGMVAECFELYISDEDPAIPLLSPVNGNLQGFPPTILISGTRDLLLSDTVRMHRALREAGVKADLHVYDGQSHGDYMQNLLRYVPECEDAQRELSEFFSIHLK